MSPVGPGYATLNDEEVNIAIHTITRNLPIYQNLRSLYCQKLMKLTTHVVNSNIMLNSDGAWLPSMNVMKPEKNLDLQL